MFFSPSAKTFNEIFYKRLSDGKENIPILFVKKVSPKQS
jgi:hypothetical protein